MDYLSVKWLHVLSSTVLFGAGIGSAFYLLMATLGRDARAVATVSRYVVIADWVFTATTVVFQPLSGFWLMHLAGGMPWSTPWIAWSVVLYALAIACWLPVVWIQLRLRDLSARSGRRGRPIAACVLAPFPLVGGIGLRRLPGLPGNLLPDGGKAAAFLLPEAAMIHDEMLGL